jgi:hypothetical protein
MKQIKACGAAVSVISGELDVGSYYLPMSRQVMTSHTACPRSCGGWYRHGGHIST